MRRRILSLLLALLLALPCAAASVRDLPSPDEAHSYVVDEAGVISEDTVQYIDDCGSALEEACGGQIVFAVVDFTGAYAIDDYAYELFNKWGVGDKKKNNGLLFVLATGAEDYYAMPGEGLTGVFTGSRLQRILDEEMEPDFAVGDYDAAVRKTFDAALDVFVSHYGIEWNTVPENRPDPAAGRESGGILSGVGQFFRAVILLVLVVAVVLFFTLLARSVRLSGPGRYRYGGSDGFWRGMFLGSLLNRPRGYYRPPPPPPPPFGGPGRPPRPPRNPGGFGGFGGGTTRGGGTGRSGGAGFGGRPGGGFSSPRPPAGRGFGGFGGGHTRGGGAGRR